MIGAAGGGGRSTLRFVRTAVALVAAAGLAGCATYTDRMSAASLAAGTGNYESAIGSVNGLLGVSSSDQVPSTLGGDKPLLLLDRGSLQQATTRFDASQRDFSTAEQKLELLDLSTNGLATLGSYLYSDSAKTYKTPPSERLAVNAVNLLNYLARGDLSGAAVEARRFQVMREYLSSVRAAAPGPDRLGAYLSGFVFEQSGEGDRALRYYDEVWSQGGSPSLVEPVRRLARSWPYRGKNLSSVVGGAGAGSAARPAELLVVLSLGRAPHKIPNRMPVGAAVGIAGAFLGDRDLDILSYSATKVLVYPELVATPSSIGTPTVRVNGREVPVELVADIGSTVAAEYQAAKPKILAAALTRVAARAAVSAGTRVAGNKESEALGVALSLVVEATMVALDKPDTRSWSMLPDRVMVARVPVAPGTVEVAVSYGGGGQRNVRVTVPNGGYGAVVLTEMR
jgi:hypothetical protein